MPWIFEIKGQVKLLWLKQLKANYLYPYLAVEAATEACQSPGWSRQKSLRNEWY